MPEPTDYRAVEIPPDVPDDELLRPQRRALLLAEIESKGHPRLLPSQTKLSERFDCSQSSISRDFDALAEYVSETMGERTEFVVNSVLDKCVRELLAAGEYRDAARTVTEWGEWVDRRATLKDLADRLDQLDPDAGADGSAATDREPPTMHPVTFADDADPDGDGDPEAVEPRSES